MIVLARIISNLPEPNQFSSIKIFSATNLFYVTKQVCQNGNESHLFAGVPTSNLGPDILRLLVFCVVLISIFRENVGY
jgi:hypothetical protein